MKWFQKLVNVTLDLMHILTEWNCLNFSLKFSFSFQDIINVLKQALYRYKSVKISKSLLHLLII